MRANRGLGRSLSSWMAAWLLLGCAGVTRTRQGDRVDVSGYPPEIQEAYAVFAFRCSRCHTLARPLNAGIADPEHWRRYVTRMRRNPGSGINAHNADAILRFLLFYTEHEKGDGRELDVPRPAVSPPPAAAPVVVDKSDPAPSAAEASPEVADAGAAPATEEVSP